MIKFGMGSTRRRRKQRDLIEKVINGKKVVICSERVLQTKVFQWLDIERPKIRPYCFAVPNGGSRHPAEAKSLKDQGVTASIPDIVVLIPTPEYHGLLIEMKREDVNDLSPGQEKKFELFRGVGYRCEMCNTLQQAKNVFDNYCIGSELFKEYKA